jgi:hypothetical protein
MALNDLLFTQGQDNMAGIIGEIYLVPSAHAITIPALAAASSLSITDNIVLDTGKSWKRLYFTDETGKVDFTPVGERDGRALQTIVSCRYPKLNKELFDWLRSVQNGTLLVMFKMANSGKKFVIGLTQFDITSTELTTDIPVYFEAVEGSSGDTRASQNGALISFKYTSHHGPIEYNGTVDLTV